MSNRQYLPISYHQTLNDELRINWDIEYSEEYHCPHCEECKLTQYHYCKESTCKAVLFCNNCQKRTYLTCSVPIYISRYVPSLECPNPLCNSIGHNSQKGWIYKTGKKYEHCICHFCGINFNPNSQANRSWINLTKKKINQPFDFDSDIWLLQYFFSDPDQSSLKFDSIEHKWYCNVVKTYLYSVLQSNKFTSDSKPRSILSALKQLEKVIDTQKISDISEINRNSILTFLSNCKNNKNITINQKLNALKDFFEWLDLDISVLIRSRDFLKVSKNDADWLDEVTRQAIKQHLDKIPPPIARQYLIQAYIAARPVDVCLLSFDCLIEQNGKCYVKFFQRKTQRWHRILASRKIRKVIEEQQQWIREVFGVNYFYLFCHFRSFGTKSYPKFSTIKPLPQPPITRSNVNPMVRVIRMLIDKENVLDANGQKPHFTGKITRHSRLQEVRTKYGMEAAQLYADHKSSTTTFQHYAPPTREQIAQVDLPFQKLLLNPDNQFLPWQSLPESLLENPTAHELDLEIAPRIVVYGHCSLNPKTPCPVNLFPKCYGCSSFRPSTGKLPLYERQYEGEQQRLNEAETAGAELASEEAKATITAMDKWLPELRRLANG